MIFEKQRKYWIKRLLRNKIFKLQENILTLWKSNIVKEKSILNKIYIQFWSTSKYITDLRHTKQNSANCWFIQRQIFVNNTIEQGFKGRDPKIEEIRRTRAKRWRSSLENFEEIVTSFLEFDSPWGREREKEAESEKWRNDREKSRHHWGMGENFLWSSWLDYDS